MDDFLNHARLPVSPEHLSNALKNTHRFKVADLHADALLWNARDLLKTTMHPFFRTRPIGSVDLPRLIAGKIHLQVFAVRIPSLFIPSLPFPLYRILMSFSTPSLFFISRLSMSSLVILVMQRIIAYPVIRTLLLSRQFLNDGLDALGSVRRNASYINFSAYIKWKIRVMAFCVPFVMPLILVILTTPLLLYVHLWLLKVFPVYRIKLNPCNSSSMSVFVFCKFYQVRIFFSPRIYWSVPYYSFFYSHCLSPCFPLPPSFLFLVPRGPAHLIDNSVSYQTFTFTMSALISKLVFLTFFYLVSRIFRFQARSAAHVFVDCPNLADKQFKK